MLAAIGNHLWQSTLFALVAGLLAVSLRKRRAHVRHGLWLAASFKFLMPFSLLVLLGSRLAEHTAHLHTGSQWSALMERVAQPLSPAAQPSMGAVLAAQLHEKPHFDVTSIAIAVWVCGIAVVACVSVLRWLRIRDALRTAQPFTGRAALDCPIAVKLSTTRMEPGVIGILRPVLLLPRGIDERLRPEQLQTIIAHELCHVRRRDNLTGMVHLVVEALFWFHPLIWWIGARILEERERACDEAVLEGGSDPIVYAEGLLNVCELYLSLPLDCAAGVTGTGLKKRIEAIMRNQLAKQLHVAHKALLAMGALLAVAVPVIAGELRAPEARAQAPEMVPDSPDGALASITEGSPGGFQGVLIAPTGKFTVRNFPLKSLIAFAYDLQPLQILGPADELSRLYSVDAQADGEAQSRALARRMLTDRFELESHWETRRAPTYTLLSGTHSGLQQAAPGDPGPFIWHRNGSYTGQALPFAWIVTFLSGRSDRPILDQTGLAGAYNFTLSWGPEAGAGGTSASVGGAPGGAQMAALIDAMQKQLGIRVVPQEGDVKFLVIDAVAQPANLVARSRAVPISPAVFDRYVGHYACTGNMVMTVSRDGGRFLAQLSGQSPVEIFAASEREFFAKTIDATFTFETNAEGAVTELILHQNGLNVIAPRMTETAADADAEEIARRVREQQAAPGSEAVLRKHIEAWQQRDQPEYDDVDPSVAAVVRSRWAHIHEQFSRVGRLSSIEFKKVDPSGADIYEVHFEKGAYEMQISLNSEGKIGGLSAMPIPAP